MHTHETHTITHYERRMRELEKAMQEERQRHEKAMEAMRFEFRTAFEGARQIGHTLDSAKLLLAEHVLFVWGRFSSAGDDRERCRQDAITDLLEGGTKLRESYFGTKNYDRWHGQDVRCSYGSVPRHGTVIFQIGMTKARRANPAPLTDEEVEAAVYYLNAIETIQSIEDEAKARADAVATGAASA